MVFTEAQIDALDEAIATGALTVRYEDKTVTYRSLDEMMRIRAHMQQALSPSYTGGSATFAQFSKG